MPNATGQNEKRYGVKNMWKNQNEAARTNFDAKQELDLKSLGNELATSLMNEQFKKGFGAVAPQAALGENSTQLLSSPIMKTYADAITEFTKNATAFAEHLPLLAKARTAYEEAMKASAEMRKVLDVGEESLRGLMTQLEQGVSLQPSKLGLEKKSSEPAKVEVMRGMDDGKGSANKRL